MEKPTELLNTFLIRKAFELIRCVGNNENGFNRGKYEVPMYPLKISGDIDTTYSHCMSLVEILERENIIKVRKKGRTQCIKLTIKGEEIYEHINSIHNIFERLDKVENIKNQNI